MHHGLRLSIAALALAVGTAQVAQADILSFTFPLSGAQEVPSNASAGSGVCTVTLDDVSGAVTVTGSYANLGTAATAAHIHGPAPAGVNAGILIGLSHTGGTTGTLSGGGVLSGANITNMINGLTYVNVHTAGIPGGEIRGQVIQTVPTMGEWAMIALGAAVLAAGLFYLKRRSQPLAVRA